MSEDLQHLSEQFYQASATQSMKLQIQVSEFLNYVIQQLLTYNK